MPKQSRCDKKRRRYKTEKRKNKQCWIKMIDQCSTNCTWPLRDLDKVLTITGHNVGVGSIEQLSNRMHFFFFFFLIVELINIYLPVVQYKRKFHSLVDWILNELWEWIRNAYYWPWKPRLAFCAQAKPRVTRLTHSQDSTAMILHSRIWRYDKTIPDIRRFKICQHAYSRKGTIGGIETRNIRGTFRFEKDRSIFRMFCWVGVNIWND